MQNGSASPSNQKQRMSGAKVVSLTLITGLITACTPPPVTTFDLASTSLISHRAERSGEALIIMEPIALQSFDGTMIVARGRGGELTMFNDAQWSDRLPRLMQAQIIRAFEDTGRLGRVARPNDGFVTARQLNTDVRQFNIDSVTGEAVVEVSARVVESVSGRVIRARIFTGRIPVAKDISGPAAAIALDAAMAKVLIEMVEWA